MLAGKGYWACSTRAESCKFWQWDESTGVNLQATIHSLPNNHELTQADVAFMRANGVAIYSDAVVFKSVQHPHKRKVRLSL